MNGRRAALETVFQQVQPEIEFNDLAFLRGNLRALIPGVAGRQQQGNQHCLKILLFAECNDHPMGGDYPFGKCEAIQNPVVSHESACRTVPESRWPSARRRVERFHGQDTMDRGRGRIAGDLR
ncbi:MAG TPA: hypothetical protein VLO11_15110, partial [Luteolibacter sp.]|nr:hypothetical protein [Luteolibacter sp.]